MTGPALFRRLMGVTLVLLGLPCIASQGPGADTSTLPSTLKAQPYSSEQVDKGSALFGSQCGFCHGRDARGGETGPDLARSSVVANDDHGDKIGVVVRVGRADKGMPQFSFSDEDLSAIVAFLHAQKSKMDSLSGKRKTVEASDLRTGDAAAGAAYFEGQGRCTQCHSSTGDLAGVGSRLEGLLLMQRMLNPTFRGSSLPGPAVPQESFATVTVALPTGQSLSGKLAYRDEFIVALIDGTGAYRSFDAGKVKFKVDDPLQVHYKQLGKYTDKDIHDLIAFLETLR